MIRFLSLAPMLFKASRECPLEIEASPITTITFLLGSATAIPAAAERAVPA